MARGKAMEVNCMARSVWKIRQRVISNRVAIRGAGHTGTAVKPLVTGEMTDLDGTQA
jgi:hypothetical protein